MSEQKIVLINSKVYKEHLQSWLMQHSKIHFR